MPLPPARPIALAVIIGLVGAEASGAPASTPSPAPRTVVTIFWGPEDFPSSPMVNDAIRQALALEPAFPIDYFVEYLESDLFAPEHATEALRHYMRTKYQGRRIDLVIAVADPALRFVLDHRGELFPDAPIVYSGVALPAEAVREAGADLTGVLRGLAYHETLALALQLHPSTERVVVVANGQDWENVNAVRAELSEFSRTVHLSYIDAPTVDGLLAEIKALTGRSFVLYIWQSQAQPRMYASQVARVITAASRVPVYGTNEQYIGSGVVGGVVRGTIATGTRLGEMARQILSGTPPADIPVEQARLVPTFDWRQLRRWGIDPSVLPAESDIRFRVPGPWETYRSYVIASAIVIGTQLVLIAGLLTHRAKRRRAERIVRASEVALRSSYERIRQLARGLIKAQEVARANMARDLHDGVCQDLVGVSVTISCVKRSAGRIEEASTQEALAKLEQSVLRTAAGVRQLSHDLHPATLRLLRLAVATKTHCLEVERRHDVQVSFSSEGDFSDVHPDVALCVFRIAQEALRNAAVHGDAHRLEVALIRSSESIELTVADDGRGFDLDAVRCRRNGGLGLVSMEERAQLVDGNLEIITQVGHGTIVRVRVPSVSTEREEDRAVRQP
jgi:signal transduction histidine kinase